MDIRRRMIFRKKASSSGGSTTAGSYTVNLNGQWEKTTSISNPDSTLYDGVYRSFSNYNVNNGVAIMYINIKDCSSFKMYIRSYAESNYDYVMVSQLDQTINGNTSYSNTTLVKAHTRGNQQSGTALSSYTLVEFTGITSGEHTITVVYRKDSSVNSGDDRGYVLIPKSNGSSDSGSGGDDEGGSSEGPINIDNYLTILALEDGLTASLSPNACEYCIDGDGNWKSLAAGITTESINSGHTLSFRGNLTPNTTSGIGTFAIHKKCNLLGNCMSLLFGDNAANNYSLSGNNYAFRYLFSGCTAIIQVSETFLPATTLASSCYYYMFYNCTSLTTAPELPATTLAYGCYYSMFNGCTSLTTAPELPATTLASSCYHGMFNGCSNLNYIKMLATDISASNCLYNWVYEVAPMGEFVKHSDMTSLPTGSSGIPLGWTGGNPTDPSNCLTIYALEDGLQVKFNRNSSSYVKGYMYYSVDGGVTWILLNSGEYTPEINTENTISFKGNMRSNSSEEGIGSFTITKKCTLNGILYSLTAGDDGANVTYASSAYGHGLFKNNTTIISAKNLKLPATSLGANCYSYMFAGCTSLTTAPELPATTLEGSCYRYMFSLCTSLIVAPELPATTLKGWCYQGMFNGCNNLNYIKMLATDISVSMCLSNWVNAVSSTGTFVKNPAMTSLPTGSNGIPRGWTVVDDTPILYTSSDGNIVTPYNTSVFGANIVSNNYVNDQGIISFDGPVTMIGQYAFYNCDGLTSVNIPDSVTTIGANAFRACDSLTSVNIPDSVTTIGANAFANCTSLTSVYCKATTPPELDSYVFYSNGSGRKIYVPVQSVDTYKSATDWNEYASEIVGYNF